MSRSPHINTRLIMQTISAITFLTFAWFLQQLCGFEYTSKLQRMFQDMNVSRDLNDHFKKHLAATEPLDSKFYITLYPVFPHICYVISQVYPYFECWIKPNSSIIPPPNFDKYFQS